MIIKGFKSYWNEFKILNPDVNIFKAFIQYNRIHRAYKKCINQIFFSPTEKDLEHWEEIKKTPWGPTVGWKNRTNKTGS